MKFTKGFIIYYISNGIMALGAIKGFHKENIIKALCGKKSWMESYAYELLYRNTFLDSVQINFFLICWIFWILIVSYDKKFKDSCNRPSLNLSILEEWLSEVTLTTKALNFSSMSIWL